MPFAAGRRELHRLKANWIAFRTRQRFKRFLRHQTPNAGAVAKRFGLDILRHGPDFDPRALTAEGLYLDEPALQERFALLGTRIGAVDPRWGMRFSMRVTNRVVRQLGRRASVDHQIDEDLAAKAWYFAIWTEICTLVPARHLARRLAKDAAGRIIVIPLASTRYQYLCYWDRNELEPFYLAFALRRCGARVLLTLEDTGAGRGVPAKELILHFAPHGAWSASAPSDVPAQNQKAGTALVLSGLRYHDYLTASHPGALNFACSHAVHGVAFNADLGGDAVRPHPVAIAASASPAFVATDHLTIASIDPDSLDLAGWATWLLCEPTKAAYANAERYLSAHDVSRAYVADHMFFVSSVVAHATRKRGGAVVVWPHSSMACHQFMYKEGDAASVVCMTRSAERVWARQLPSTPTCIKSAPALVPDCGPRNADPSAPLSIVVFGSAYALARMPILDRRRHEETYRSLFRGVNGLGTGVRIFFKPKTSWEPTEWLKNVLGADIPFEETTDSPYEIEQPNLIFMTVSFASTALLEGLSRGIPCMIAREFPVEDYMTVDPDYCPTEGADAIVDRIGRCRDLEVLRRLAARQIGWYRDETRF